MTRGRESNIAYVAVDRPDDAHGTPQPADDPAVTARSVLAGVLTHVGAEQSAHATLRTEQETWSNIGQLAAEYDTIAAAAQHDRWVALLRSSPLTAPRADAVVASEAFGALCANLRRAEANHHDVDVLLPRLITARGLDDAVDVAAVLDARLASAAGSPAGSARARRLPLLIVGLIPEAVGPIDPDMRRALEERRRLIEQRAVALADAAIRDRAPWTRALGTPPRHPRDAALWQRQVQILAAYRDRYAVTGSSPLGAPAESIAQRRDAAQAANALARSEQYTADATPTWTSARARITDHTGLIR
jgi:hypothetical protein